MKTTTPSEAKATLDQNPNAVYLDVRTEQEFAQGHPVGAINVPVMVGSSMGMQPNVDFLRVVQSALSAQQTILCGCKSGGRSQRAAQLLADAGFADVTNVLGGWSGGPGPDGAPISGWAEEGLPCATDDGDGVSYASLKKKARK